jgi:hypothetical protein
MHPDPMRKPHMPYSFFEVAEFLQTRLQNAYDKRVAKRDAKNPYAIGFFGDGRRATIAEEGARFRRVPLCPSCSIVGKELGPKIVRPPASARLRAGCAAAIQAATR